LAARASRPKRFLERLPAIQAFPRSRERLVVAARGKDEFFARIRHKTHWRGAFPCAGSLLAFFSALASAARCDLGAVAAFNRKFKKMRAGQASMGGAASFFRTLFRHRARL
jgi:hypothetical protein